MSSREKRAHERFPVQYPVTVRCPSGDNIAGTVDNIGALGALISTLDLESTVEVGDQVELTIDMPGLNNAPGPVLVTGEVLRLEQEFYGGEIRRAFAIRFDFPVPH